MTEASLREKIYAVTDANYLVVVATVDERGESPKLRVMAPAREGDVFWFNSTQAAGGKLRQVARRPAAELFFTPDGYRRCVLAAGEMVLVTAGDEKRRVFPLFLKGQQRLIGSPEAPNFNLLKFTTRRYTYLDHDASEFHSLNVA